MKSKICFITGSRSEFGIMSYLLKELNLINGFDLRVILTGSHLSSFYGNTIEEVKKSGIKKIYKAKIINSNYGKIETSVLMSKALIKINELLKLTKPQIVILVGDRYETFSAAIACYNKGIPIIHFHGGEITQNSLDDNYRHSISKLSNYHFVSTKTYKKRLIQLGENSKNIIISGSLSLKNIDKKNLVSKINIEKKFKLHFRKKNILVTFHSETLSKTETLNHIKIVLKSIKSLKNTSIIFTMPGADMNNDIIYREIKKIVRVQKNCYFVKSFGSRYYYSVLNIVDLMLGNSSSGIIEMPHFNKPTINLGRRQYGRVMPNSVINIKLSTNLIKKKLLNLQAKNKPKKNIKNPYKNKMTFKDIANVIKKISKKKVYYKNFNDLIF